VSIEKTAEALRKRGYTVTVFETKEEAADHLVSLFDGEVIGIGGSRTIGSLKVYDRLKEKNTLWYNQTEPVMARDMFREYTAYLSSVNGVSEAGEMVNIDGLGNRLASTLYGPKKVVFVVGRNKITPDLSSAIERARQIAAPLNAKRLKKNTPCAVTGKCMDCKSPERICGSMVIYMKPMNGFKEPTEVILINEDLGL